MLLDAVAGLSILRVVLEMSQGLWRVFLTVTFFEVLYVGWTGLPESWLPTLLFSAAIIAWNFIVCTLAASIDDHGTDQELL